MNTLLFCAHSAVLVSFILISLRIGKEALTSALVIQVILANLFVTKQINLFGLDVTCAEVYTIGAIFSLNLLQTYFGKRYAKRSFFIVFFLLFFVMLMSQFHLGYIPSKYDQTHHAFGAILGNTPRIMISSFFCAFTSQKVDLELFGWIRRTGTKLPFFIPFSLASLITQFLDTVLFSFVALYGIVHSMKDIIFMSYLVKVVVIFSIAPFTLLVKRLVPHEPVQV